MKNWRDNSMTWALGLSALAHLLALAVLAHLAAVEAFAARSREDTVQDSVVEEVLLVAEVSPAAEPEQQFIEVDQAADRPPERRRFISDRNSVAASEGRPDPEAADDLPAQEGIDVPVVEVVQRELLDGEDETAPALSAAAPAAQAEPKGALRPPAPEEDVSSASAPPEPEAAAAPQSAENVATSNEADISVSSEDAGKKPAPPVPEVALREPAVEPAPTDQTRRQDRPPEQAQPSPATPSIAANRFQGQKEKTRLSGAVARQGEASVDAEDTPVGRYIKQVTSAIEKEWHRKRRVHADFVTYGTIRLEFYVRPDGRIEGLSIRNRDGANAIMQDFTLSAVLEAKIPPMPSDLPEVSGRERLRITYDIIVY